MTELPQVHRATSRRKLAKAAFWLVAVAGALWFVTAANRTMQHIWPSASLSPSTSQAPYELRFRNAFVREPSEWVLAPPRAFVFDEVGSNGSVIGDANELRENYYAVYMEAIVSSDGETLVAKTTVPRKDQRTRSLLFHIANKEANRGFKAIGGCVPQERWNEALSKVGPAGNYEDPCTERDFRCRIEVPVDGWGCDRFSHPGPLQFT